MIIPRSTLDGRFSVSRRRKRSGFSEIFGSLQQFLDAKKRSPKKRLEAVFDWLVAWIGSKEFRGCSFLKAMAEYQNLDDPVHRTALAHKVALTDEIRRLVVAAGLKRSRNLPEQLSLLLEGAIVQSHALGKVTPALRAREAARVLIASVRAAKPSLLNQGVAS